MAYTTATIKRNEPLPDGRARIFVEFTGNAGEPALERDIYIDGGTTGASLKAWVIDVATTLNSARNLTRSAALQVGQSVDLTPAAVPSPSAKDVFRDDVRLLRQMTNAITLGVKTSADADVVAQKATVVTKLTANPTWIDAF